MAADTPAQPTKPAAEKKAKSAKKPVAKKQRVEKAGKKPAVSAHHNHPCMP